MTITSAHVLVLEDDEGLLALASRVLQKQGYRVTAVADAESAQAAVQQAVPDLLIVDYQLQAPDSGLDFFRSLRAAGKDIPTIMVSGFSDELHIIEAWRAGVADVLPKTSDYLDHLPQIVQRVLAQQRQAQAAGQARDGVQQLQQLQQECAMLRASVASDRAEIERLRSAHETFLATLSHELRTPLNAILGWTGYLLHHAADPATVQKGVQVIDRNARLQSLWVEELLDSNRILLGTVPLATAPVHLAELIRDAIAAAEGPAADKQIALRAESAAVTVLGDVGRLRQVLGRLLMNAIRFTPPQGRVLLCLHRREHAIELEIRDSGRGLTPAELESLFPSAPESGAIRGDMVASTAAPGLAVAGRLVALHGGRLRAASAGPGQGASFFVSLPLA
ncbi:hybrid sensor histidine kinase/response regulator [Herbaspirillum sp. C9C3]|uniref:hybrid sensor histidine kinase/response regulator n=1 Tax=Herbaspirillum sp. C9C3 TaxID=2735271 RepID=UPI001584C3C2|nr:hybrid sensor histidine kinase/response regulator [Herbaspirillum sp. C9C3]NUT61306.1 hybrid sensor histidine kinase/response regulator [Herbaspirillum sp. C9C3]